MGWLEAAEHGKRDPVRGEGERRDRRFHRLPSVADDLRWPS
mgnify:CR=1 FL=1